MPAAPYSRKICPATGVGSYPGCLAANTRNVGIHRNPPARLRYGNRSNTERLNERAPVQHGVPAESYQSRRSDFRRVRGAGTRAKATA